MPNKNGSIPQPSLCRLAIFFCILLVLCYSNTFNASWQLDDSPQILNNDRIQISELSLNQLYKATHARIGSNTLYRPVATLTLGLNWYYGKNNVFGYHVVNFLIHFSTCWLLFLTIKTLFSTPRLKARYHFTQIYFIAALAAILWALNPAQIQAVTYIVQRMASLATFFSLLGLFLYVNARLVENTSKKYSLFLAATLSYLLAVFSKENAAAVILCIPVIELIFFQLTYSRTIARRLLLGIFIGLLITILGAFSLRPELFDFILYYYHNRPFTLSERLLTEQRILVFYLSQLFYPAPYRFSVEYDIALSTSLLTPRTTIPAILFNLGLIAAALKYHRKMPLLSIGILFFYLNHLVESTIVPLELIFDHRNYLPSLFIFLPISQFASYLIYERITSGTIKYFMVLFLSFLLISLGYATYHRNKDWQTSETLWLSALETAPNSSRPYASLALQLAFGQKRSVENYQKALQLTERSIQTRMARKRLDAAQIANIASIHTYLGNYDTAIAYYHKSLELLPNDIKAQYNLSKAYLLLGAFDKVEQRVRKIIIDGYIHADYHLLLGHVLLWQAQPEKALPELRQAMRYAPGRPDVLIALANCLSKLGHFSHANRFLHLARNHGDKSVVLSLAMIENYLMAGKRESAVKELQRSLAQYPIPFLLQPFNDQSGNRFRRLPLSEEIIRPFIHDFLQKQYIDTTSMSQ